MDEAESLADVRNNLSKLIDEIQSTHRRVPVTKHGKVSVYMVSPDDLAVLEERIRLLSLDGEKKLLARLNQAAEDIKNGDYATLEEVMERIKRRL